jgi:hypothetical protein
MPMMESLVTFAGGNEKALDTYKGMRDYYFHYMSAVEGKKGYGDFDASVSLDEKEEKMHNALLAEVERVSGCPRGNMPFEAWSMSPQVKWATFAVVGAMIDAVLPDTIIKSVGIYTDMHTVGFGETLEFEVQPNSIFTVSQSANAQRKGFNKKQFAINETLQAVPYQITVQTQLYKVLSGKENLARFVRKAVISVETKMNLEAYNTLAGLVANASFPAPLKVTGYSADDAITLAQTVEAYNQGAKVSFIGTKKAIYQMLPDASKGYRMITDASAPQINIVRGVFDWDIIELPQVATGVNYGLALDDHKVYVMSTGADKVIKGVIEGVTLANSNDFYDTADLTSSATMTKRFGFAAVSNTVMGVITV